MKVELSAKQQEALDAVGRLAPGQTLFVKGYAGTGKSTLLAAISDRYTVGAVAAPTGKAAARLRALGVRAITLHSMLYVPIDVEGKDDLLWQMKEEIKVAEGDLVCVDEASMQGRQISEDFARLQQALGLRIVFIGDGFQLPPVSNTDEFDLFVDGLGIFAGAEVIELTEVFRQALESPILAAATNLRLHGNPGPPVDQEDFITRLGSPEDAAACYVSVRTQGECDDVMAITWTNEDRHRMNAVIRYQLSFNSRYPQPGEQLVVLANNKHLDLCNGDIVTLESYVDGPRIVSLRFNDSWL